MSVIESITPSRQGDGVQWLVTCEPFTEPIRAQLLGDNPHAVRAVAKVSERVIHIAGEDCGVIVTLNAGTMTIRFRTSSQNVNINYFRREIEEAIQNFLIIPLTARASNI